MTSRDYNGQLRYWSARSSRYPRLLTLAVSRLPLEDPYRPERQRGSPRRTRALRQQYAWILAIGRANGISVGILQIQDGQLAADVACALACGNASTGVDVVKDIAFAIHSASALIVRPLSFDEGTQELLAETADSRPQKSYKALVAHPSLRRDPESFVEIAAGCNYCQLSVAEAQALRSHTQEIGMLAAEVRDAFGRDTEFAITNGSGPGCLWAEHDWFPIRMPRDRLLGNVDIGNVFCAAYAVARHFYGAGSRRACSYALDVTAAVMRSVPVPSYVR